MTHRPAITPGALLIGRRAVVTGGAAGIGAAIARSFASHGAAVLVADIEPGQFLDFDRSAGGTIAVLEWDVTTRPVATELVDHRPDILVNNVGHYLRAPRPFTETRPDLWDALHDINIGHVLSLTHALLPGITERQHGSIINLTTVEAHRAIPGHTVYSAYKAALMQFTRSLAAEVGPSGVRVNAIAPDLIETVQVPYAELVPEQDRALWPTWSPLGGPGLPEDVAGAALFLASDLARFVTGTTIHVDGGTHSSGGWVPRASGGWTNRPRNP
ncbi:SDR family NAD(P)-dependent oxidoreductase [Nocardia donostiensis]|uniref:Oxidoreductase n=1 Tax=Nocardia donostiensis TaxID=1538463 RepID=A0A1V2TFZ7_9NOCA|nr:SDR family oxidoreductase [Nocardia donostiensis]ONM48425.1 oxidoreductase [Nocardia donostiensis]OQS16187.1 oxidoreductase [Nocardia donostiensis]OQS17835.1 oxidoreductase [Nocardia donostiensis]